MRKKFFFCGKNFLLWQNHICEFEAKNLRKKNLILRENNIPIFKFDYFILFNCILILTYLIHSRVLYFYRGIVCLKVIIGNIRIKKSVKVY